MSMATRQSEWYAAVPRSIKWHVIISFTLMIITFGGFGLWAFQAPLAAAIIAQGSFVATGQNKIVQHLEGGIIREITVREGDHVKAGQVLLRLDQTAAAANARELGLRKARLEATETRLLAQYNRKEVLVFPQALQAERADNEIASILDGQMISFQVAETALKNDIGLLQRNIEALKIRSLGYEIQLDAQRRQLTVLDSEMETKDDLLERGLVRSSEVSSIQLAQIEAQGQIGRLVAEVNEIEQVNLKYEQQIAQTLDRYRQLALENLQTIQSELDGVREKSRTAVNVRERSDVLAPVSGTVVRLYYHTGGGVVESGRPILEILPESEPLIVEVQIPRNDIDSVRTGQPVTVRLTALNQRTTPVLNGEVFYVSADSVTDTSTGVPTEVYVARVSLSIDQIRRVRQFTPTPGMPAQIMIQTAERTFAQYLAKPIADSMTRAFREQ
ncbi:HlyD family type I secretion periplasmic adaptor subunit [Pseudorhodobacter turbinis]|uniref:Membrane fusion protein (MFP) family protein n=1 Tax=Pseudorhodobacter turbinis TaxID=2500533 RepID=A0A4P8ECC1_9RHOB|nr:HlyD family type I secretion periplasmic adaptor subunit [Pseudorhodobacter turbinis]QCO54412.1 HlyD family type I secretion periplasmic adaptor subunit [Pseudorhodobacter turbinis]